MVFEEISNLRSEANSLINKLQSEHGSRVSAIYDEITSGRRFPGVLCTNTTGNEEVQQFVRRGLITWAQRGKIYFTDGSRITRGPMAGVTASAVVYQNDKAGDGDDVEKKHEWEGEAIAFERNIASIDDAELYAVKMALEMARMHQEDGDYGDLDYVVVFTDSARVVRLLPGHSMDEALGPAQVDGEEDWALERIYEETARLEELGVKVIIAWVKAHMEANEGNAMAHKAATMAAKSAPSQNDFITKELVECKELWDERTTEYMFRKSGPFFKWKKGQCFIEPTLDRLQDMIEVLEAAVRKGLA